MYVVVRARVLQLGAELAMLSDFMENYLFQENHTVGSNKLRLKATVDIVLSDHIIKELYAQSLTFLDIFI